MLLREPLTLEEIKKVIDELSEMRTFELCITGGEPLLDQRLPEVVKYACGRGFTVNITTNGLLVNRELAKKLATCKVNVQVPLHSSDFKIHDELTGMPGSFEKAIDTIKLLVNLNMNVSVITILQKANKDDLRNMLPSIKELGVHVWNIVELKPVGRADNSMAIPLKERLKILEELEREANKLGIQIIAEKPFFFVGDKGLSQTLINDEFYKLFTRCGVRTGRYVEITPDGFVYPCDLLLGDTFPNLIAGDLRQNTFKEIWHSSEILNKFRTLKQEDMHGKCKSCIYFDLCGGKCRALAYRYYDGDLYAPDPRCPYEPK